MYSFVNRSAELEVICNASSPYVVLNIFGESGIGKTRLLDQAIAQVSSSFVLKIDLERLLEVSPDQRPGRLVALLEDSAGGGLRNLGADAGAQVAQIVAALVGQARLHPMFLFFDTTEALQDDILFWRWLEAHLVGPLVFESYTRLVFAGRIPVPFSRIEVRRALQLLHLLPLSTSADQEATGDQGDAAAGRTLVREIIMRHNSSMTIETLNEAIDLVLEFSFGHPLLSEQVAVAVSGQMLEEHGQLPRLRNILACEVVKPFIEDRLFKAIKEPWKRILELASVLNWFDPVILMRYLRRADPALVEGRQDDFFLRGVTQLRQQHTVVWRGAHGDTLHGVIAPIVRRCLEVAEPERYRQACAAAAETFREFAQEELPVASPEYELYLEQADLYRLCAQGA